MKKNSLSTKGLSLSQAQSISNLCFQESRDIQSKIENINNCEKTLTLPTGVYVETQGFPIPENIGELLHKKATLHATQAFLMENIQAKSNLIEELKNRKFVYNVPKPEEPNLEYFFSKESVDEDWGWDQLTVDEHNEYLESEAYASHYGQFIHKGGKLDKLRNELPKLKTLEWIEIEKDKKTPLDVSIHHTIDQLGDLHKEFSSIHRDHEQRVNYFKAKVKNLVTIENARIANENADTQGKVNDVNKKLTRDYVNLINEWQDNYRKSNMEFNAEIQNEIGRVSSLRISVDSRFKPVIDQYLSFLKEE
jgi:hypothetical protein